ncbi:hypothetical protein HMPREF1485_01670 [Propionibacterium sp. HGH0353]|uniref:FtsK/SpoIIIE domain-containing protein n=1 Tax=Cutibacterium avidum TaxID=33010 RepID=A0A1B9VRA1_9ACTN|nr:FtsK/SpoIIIE domain-containing protein [Cutibacterium avidum]EPH01331.1 hypothetical protein HMPREF1485_01670 [Propionibacterium sp. HGH0353]MBS6260299.1 hypothetical protein [Propionibacterium sp.]AOG27902.1 hypothetical protein BFS79_04480 [Cutibacterium avidum]MCO6662604.1 hypothetical protein [Cutibacterium avidum]MCO6673770.1 hypothetical protein [Cutibacterium avidum]
MTVATLPSPDRRRLGVVAVAGAVWRPVRVTGVFVWRLLRGMWHGRWWFATCYMAWFLVAIVCGIDSYTTHVGLWVAAAAWLVPLVGGAWWSLANPFTFDKYIAGPWRRWGWRRWARKNWDEVARECGLSSQRTVTKDVRRTIKVGDHLETIKEPRQVTVWTAPYLPKIETRGDTLVLRVRPRIGQVFEDIEAALEALRLAAGASSARTQPVNDVHIEVQLMMRNALASGREATLTTRDSLDTVGVVPAGRTLSGDTWFLQVIGRQTLVVGASGAGKGSPVWSVCGYLAPAIPTGEVQLWGIDLKHGLELGMGKDLFCCMATTPAQALAVLQELLAVIAVRGAAMFGTSRLHEPRPGDPLHVLIIDELAVLTSYGPPEIVKEASRLLSEILTQGRALGVVVVAAVQDPRKETVGMRGQFTQFLALRLNSASETRMVLGEDAATLAPAHRILLSQQGTGWIKDETGTYDKVRADYWPDKTIRDLAHRYPSPVHVVLPTAQQAAETALPAATSPVSDIVQEVTTEPRVRKPRAPRKPRQPRTTGQNETTLVMPAPVDVDDHLDLQEGDAA